MTTSILAVRRHFQPDTSSEWSQISGHVGRPGAGDEVDGKITLAGWCASPQRRLIRLVAYVAGTRTEIDINLPSEDVAVAQPNLVGGKACRFRGVVQLPPSARDQVVELFAEDERRQLAPFCEILVGCREATAAGALDSPVFVVGSPRSGTTILGNTIRYSLGLRGFDESHVLPLFTHLRATARNFYETPHYTLMRQTKGTMVANLPLSLIESSLATMFREFYASFHGNEHFVDKNPGPDMLRAIPGLLLAWPKARFVFAKRRAIENLVSRQRKFDADRERFRMHCKDWADAMDLWLKHRDAVPAGQWIEVDQLDIAQDPTAVSERLAAFLGVPARAKTFAEYIMSHTPQKTTTDDWKVLDLAETGWDEESLAVFREICGPAMAAWGYSTDNRYLAAPASGGESPKP